MESESILDNVKSYLGLLSEDTSFDADVLMAINAVMSVLHQLGVGPKEHPFVVSSSQQTWTDLLGTNPVGGVREYVNMRVRLLFDPPTNIYVVQSLKEQIDEFQWRILADVDAEYYREVANERELVLGSSWD